MGVFKVRFWIGSLDKKNMVMLEGYVDTGATYSIIPGEILDRVGVEKARKLVVKGVCCVKTVDVGDALFRIEVNGEIVEGVSSVVFGDDPHLILLGSHALEALGLEVDPVNKKLKKAAYIAMY